MLSKFLYFIKALFVASWKKIVCTIFSKLQLNQRKTAKKKPHKILKRTFKASKLESCGFYNIGVLTFDRFLTQFVSWNSLQKTNNVLKSPCVLSEKTPLILLFLHQLFSPSGPIFGIGFDLHLYSECDCNHLLTDSTRPPGLHGSSSGMKINAFILKLVSQELIHFGMIARFFRQIGGHSTVKRSQIANSPT